MFEQIRKSIENNNDNISFSEYYTKFIMDVQSKNLDRELMRLKHCYSSIPGLNKLLASINVECERMIINDKSNRS